MIRLILIVLQAMPFALPRSAYREWATRRLRVIAESPQDSQLRLYAALQLWSSKFITRE